MVIIERNFRLEIPGLLTTVIRQCMMLLALVAVAFMFMGGTESAQATQNQTGLHISDGVELASESSLTKTSCKQHKVRSHNCCSTNSNHSLISSFNRNRNAVPALPPKKHQAGIFATRFALALENTTTRRILAFTLHSETNTLSLDVLSRSERLRN
jgi:hypothetical protein